MNKLSIWSSDLGCNARRKACRAALLHKRFATKQCASEAGAPNVHVICEQALTSRFNKDTPKHETCAPCVGRASARHGRLKSALRHAILVGCGRCFTLTIAESVDEASFSDWRLPFFKPGVLKGEALAWFISTQVGGRQIQELPMALGIVATDL